ncbi:hypothetical protein Dda_4883 [Drechslerella dactyloides]|uniref:Spermine/spermidine synthase n=1 Tax=Drechslerella dactyloides TaxID=74499 RepID=A0AAD6J206_DREDA|nr:hypothetical protein Dda_4883 [Drechslerella dactyloides]
MSSTALATLIICAVSSFASQISLSPVFGEIPSGLHHDKVKNTAFVAAASVALALKYTLPRSRILLRLSRLLIPLVAINIPLAQGFIWQYAKDLGAVNGPIVTEALTIGILLTFTVFSIAGLIRPVGVPVQTVAIADLSLLATSWLVFTYAEAGVVKYLSPYVGSGWPMTRCGMEATAAIFATSLHRSIFLLAALPSFFPVFYLDSRCMMGGKGLKKLNQHLDPLNFTAVARIESTTGYLSVLENKVERYRLLRCDHSILGGAWLKTVPGLEAYQDNPEHLREPIYAVFVMLEAIRLIDPPAREREDANALIIGLGIGTSASGLIQHGIKTHIVEIDAGVYKIAKDHFGLPPNHTVHIGDAVAYIANEYIKAHLSNKQVEKYDYILHDVFTGGAVPADLFTWEFLEGLKTYLKPTGVIAINYAGDLNLKSARSVIHTIKSVFGTCRAFREYPPEKDADPAKGDFTNMVIYCTPFHKPRRDPANPYHADLDESQIEAPYFYPAQESDFLNTVVRKQRLMPQHEVDLKPIVEMGARGELDVIATNNVDKLRAWQREMKLYPMPFVYLTPPCPHDSISHSSVPVNTLAIFRDIAGPNARPLPFLAIRISLSTSSPPSRRARNSDCTVGYSLCIAFATPCVLMCTHCSILLYVSSTVFPEGTWPTSMQKFVELFSVALARLHVPYQSTPMHNLQLQQRVLNCILVDCLRGFIHPDSLVRTLTHAVSHLCSADERLGVEDGEDMVLLADFLDRQRDEDIVIFVPG